MTALPADEPGAVVYRLFDSEGALLYIGHTGDIPSRFRNHKHDKPWWSEVASVTTEPYTSKAEAVEAEREAIRMEGPRYNVQLVVGSRQVVVNFRVPATVKDHALERCEREGVNLSDVLREFMTEWAEEGR